MTAVQVRDEKRNVVPAAMSSDSMTNLLQLAVQQGTPVAELKELVALAETMERRQAAREFAAAMSAFQRECPPIKKGRTAKITTKAGGSYSYTFAELDDIARTVSPLLVKNGLSFSWDSTVEKGMLTCVCTLRHEAGHSVSSSFTLPTDTNSAMSEQQKYGAALTFAKRQTLSSVLGLTTTDDDSDTAEIDPTKINDDQVTVLDDLVKESKADLARFLKYMGAPALSEIRAADYQRALAALQQKAGASR